MYNPDVSRINVKFFINEVKRYPEIWDIKSEAHKNRLQRHAAWEAVIVNMYEECYWRTEKQRKALIKMLSLKWKNLRDNFARSLRNQTKPGKEYKHAKDLAFLFGPAQSHDAQLTVKEEIISFDDSTASPYEVEEEEETNDPLLDTWAPSMPSSSIEEGSPAERQQHEPIVEIEPMDDDRLFFHSLHPFIKNFTESQKLELWNRVIAIIRKIKAQ